MSIKSVAKFYGKIIDGELEPEMIDEASEQMEEFKRYAELAQSVLLERVEEKDFVRFMLGVQKGIVAIMASGWTGRNLSRRSEQLPQGVHSHRCHGSDRGVDRG